MDFFQNGSSYIVKGDGGQQIIRKNDIENASRATDTQIETAIHNADFSNVRSETVGNINAQLTWLINDDMSKRVGPVSDAYGTQTGQIIPIGIGATNSGIEYAKIDSKIGDLKSSTVPELNDLTNTFEVNPPKKLSTSLSKQPEKVFEYKTGSGFKMQETLSGADLCIYFLSEVVDPTDIAKGIPIEACRKNLITIEFDSVLSITYSTLRERFPVRSLGMTNPKGMTSGIRTISGHVAFNIFAEDVLARLRGRVYNELYSRQSSVTKNTNQNSNASIDQANKYLDTLAEEQSIYNQTPLFREGAKSMLLDQLPPFHLLVIGVNEDGIMARMLIKDIYIIDESQYQGTQQPNIINKVSFTCKDIVPMTSAQYDQALSFGSLSALEEGYVGGNWDFSGMQDMSASSLLTSIEADSVTRSVYQGA